MAGFPIVLEDTEFKFLNFNKVLCLSPHPDDVEYAMLGSMIKFKNTQFDIVVISQGGDFDETSDVSRHKECESIWKDYSNISGMFLDIKHVKDVGEDELINKIETLVNIEEYDTIFIPPEEDAHFEHRLVNTISNALVRRKKCGIINYKTPSSLEKWEPNFFVDLELEVQRKDVESAYNIVWYKKLSGMRKFKSQQDKSFFNENVLDNFHKVYQCSMKGLLHVESFKIIKGYF
jgi:LmbE family N-acetylglucosaminyl deacetylase